MIKVVCFDLDDTLMDHRASRRGALKFLKKRYSKLRSVRVHTLEQEHEKLLQSTYSRTLAGRLTPLQALAERLQRLCAMHGLDLTIADAMRLGVEYEQAYSRHRKTIPGVIALLKALGKHVQCGVVTNGLAALQRAKLTECGLDPWLDFVIISEEVGAAKPDQGIFVKALQHVNAHPHEAVMIGDTWETDILGAIRCGMRAVWLNRYGLACPDPSLATEISDYRPLRPLLRLLLNLDAASKTS